MSEAGCEGDENERDGVTARIRQLIWGDAPSRVAGGAQVVRYTPIHTLPAQEAAALKQYLGETAGLTYDEVSERERRKRAGGNGHERGRNEDEQDDAAE